MNFFKKLFGGNTKETTANSSNENENFPIYNYELEFLYALNKTPTDQFFGLNTYWEDRYRELLGDLNPIVEKFLNEGKITISLKEEALKVSELKKILKANNLSQSGTKEVLARRVFEKISDKSYEAGLIPFYKITETGKEAFNVYRQDFLKKYFKFLKNQESLFFKKDFKKLESNHFKFIESHPNQRSLFGNFKSFGEKTEYILKKLANKEKLKLPVDFPEEFEEKLRVVLAFKSCYIHFFEEFKTYYLPQTYLDEIFLHIIKKNPAESLESKEAFIDEIINFEYNHLWNQAKLEEILKFKRRSPNFKYEGIQILNSGCKCNEEFGEEKYTWDQLDHLPTLPRFTKCICIYNLM